jgi:long-chain acyl-CoA synthetase
MANLASIIESHDADHVALISRNRPTTYGALRDQVAAMRGSLLAAGIAPGERVVLICTNTRHFVVGYLAIVGIGAVAVPLNPTSPAPEILREVTAVGAAAALVGPTAIATWSSIDPDAMPSIRLVVTAEPADGAVSFDEMLQHAPAPIVETDDDDLAVLMFTSGTAGAPRAAMLSHGNLLSNIRQSSSGPDPVRPTDVVYGVLPLSHIFGLNVVLGVSLAAGATVLLVQRFDPSTFVESVVDRGVTVIPGVPPMWMALAQQPDVPAGAFAKVRRALTGAAKMPVEVMEALEARYGLELSEGYGLTEASPVVTSSAGIPVKRGSVGKVLDGVEVRIVDEHGEDVLLGDVGEVLVRGANVFKGYFGDPEATSRVLDDEGWLHTGDLAVVDEDGYLFLVDRAKDLIIVSGFNVYPAEVEEILLSHPLVAEAGVIGVPHGHTGEAVKAFVVPVGDAELDEEVLIDYCRDHLARYKCPSKVLVVEELPRNLSGKLIRRQLA